MSRNDERLTHHERLRLDYLSKNIYYLNDRERQELQYLQAKLGNSAVMPSREPIPPKRQAPQRPLESRAPRQNPEAFTPEGLPKMTEAPRRSRKDRRRERDRAVSGIAPRQDQLRKPAQVTPSRPNPPRPQRSMIDKEQGSPRQRGPRKSWFRRLVKAILWLIALTLLGMIIMYFKGYHSVKSDPNNAGAGKTQYFEGQATEDGTNILVLGTDVRPGQSTQEARTDSIMVVNIGNSDGKIKIVSFMRDTLINLPGYSAEGMYDHKLNTAFNLGEQANGQGAEAMRQVLKAHFDIDIQYYAMVDFASFAIAVDTLFPNGVTMNAQFGTIGGQDVTSVEVPNDTALAEGEPAYQTIHEGIQQMDGKTLLNYARFRSDDEVDAGRVRRQQEVLIAMLQQVKDPVKLFTGSEALGKIMALTSTNVPYSFMLTNGLSVINQASNIEQMSVPAQGDWIDEYDMYGGQGLLIDFEKYRVELASKGF